MKDIFGRTLGDYETLSSVEKRGNLEQFLQARCDYYLHEAGGLVNHEFMEKYAGTPHQFYRPQEFTKKLEASNGALGFVMDNFQAFVSMNEEIFYRAFRMRDYVPVLTSGIDEGATSYSVVVQDRVGRAVFGSRYDGITPRADANQRKYDAPLDIGKIDIGWTVEDARNALFVNRSIQTDKMEAAIHACNTTIEETVFFGASSISGSKGLFNLSTSGTNAVAERLVFNDTNLGSGVKTTDTWASLTNDEKVVALQRLIRRPIHNSNEIVIPRGRSGMADMIVALPPEIFDDVCESGYGDSRDHTVKEFVERTNAWYNRTGRQVIWMSTTELDDAGTPNNSSKRRIAVYVRDQAVMEFRIVIAPRMIHIVRMPRESVAPYEFKTGTLQVKRKNLVIYLDGA